MSHRIFKRQAKALIRLRICAGWSEPLLVAHTTLLEISCQGSSVITMRETQVLISISFQRKIVNIFSYPLFLAYVLGA